MSLVETAWFKEASVAADGFNVRYVEAGAGDPVLVLHGGGGLDVNATHRLIAQYARVIALEVPGFGQSPMNQRSGSLHELARTILHVADALGLERFSLMGTSFGGALAAWVATEQPQRIDKLVLVAPGAILPDDWQPPAGSPEVLKSLFFAHPDEHEWPEIEPEAAEKNEFMLRLLTAGHDPELDERLASFESPTLVLFGTEDRVTPPELAQAYADLMPEPYLAYVYDAGHAAELERPEATADIIADFLQRGPEFAVTTATSQVFP